MFARRGPGLVRAAATTAVVAGTAGAVRHCQDQKYARQDQEAYEQQMYAQQAAAQQAAPAASAEPDYAAELEKLATSNTWLTRQQLDQELDGVMDQIDVARAKDFEFLLGEITAAEWRSGKRIVNSNDALLQTMLASNPRFSEQ